ncbi:MAG TPA: hypothetical protein VJ843_02550 [Candidatus Saccharimonadales bacterium]|nr:hypothetical protein [Candidatus Saccharimonadales bacterium]
MKSRKLFYGIFTALVALNIALWFGRQPFLDWQAIRTYQAPAAVSKLASDDTMTDQAKKYFYINHPAIEDRANFNKHCPNNSEQSVVLGCFLGDRAGIYLFSVTDPELHGVEQVTAAHEMLHQAYQRLGSAERTKINKLLENYYKSGLTDSGIKDQVKLYQKSEPGAMDDEMHSLFGTEATNLPPELEDYYKQYFTKRSTVAAFYTSYQSAFTERKQQIASYDSQLNEIKPQIDSLESSLEQQKSALNTMQNQMDAYKSSGNYDAYNGLVPAYNAKVNTYNTDLESLKSNIARYNDIVAKRNAIALEEQTLQQHLSSKLQSTSAQ